MATTYRALISVGANLAGSDGVLQCSLSAGIADLCRDPRLKFVSVSGLYDTRPVGGAGRQPRYLNAVLCVEARMGPAELLRYFKALERSAGRRQRGRNAPRPLDLDIIDFGGRRIGWPAGRVSGASRHAWTAERPRVLGRYARGWLMLPHPEAHRRRFVLEPLAEIAPHWQHPVLGVPVRRLLAGLPRPPGQIRRILDSNWLSWQTRHPDVRPDPQSGSPDG